MARPLTWSTALPCGHLLQEEVPAATAEALLAFLRGN
jgi:pimeloyl-ACP methyl ester carboxylesterase